MRQAFKFRGLKFREFDSGIGMQVWHLGKWVNVAVLNRRCLESDYREVPDIGIWGKKRMSLGTVRFPITQVSG